MSARCRNLAKPVRIVYFHGAGIQSPIHFSGEADDAIATRRVSIDQLGLLGRNGIDAVEGNWHFVESTAIIAGADASSALRAAAGFAVDRRLSHDRPLLIWGRQNTHEISRDATGMGSHPKKKAPVGAFLVLTALFFYLAAISSSFIALYLSRLQAALLVSASGR